MNTAKLHDDRCFPPWPHPFPLPPRPLHLSVFSLGLPHDISLFLHLVPTSQLMSGWVVGKGCGSQEKDKDSRSLGGCMMMELTLQCNWEPTENLAM